MSDEQEDAGTDFEEKLAKIIDQKSRKRNNNDIYDRFINRVHSSDNSEQDDTKILESAQNLRAFEPLSADELQLFEHQSSEQELGLKTESTTEFELDFSDEDISVENSISPDIEDIDTTEDNTNYSDVDTDDTSSETVYAERVEPVESDDDIPLPSAVEQDETTTDHFPNLIKEESLGNNILKEPVAEKSLINNALINNSVAQNKASNNKRLIFIGITAGSVLLVVAGLAFIFLGAAPTSTVENTDITVNAKVRASDIALTSNESVAQVNNQNATNNIDAISELPLLDEQNSLDTNGQDMPANDKPELEPTDTPVSANDTTSDMEQEAAITYEDFRQESQTTLYRETND